VALSFEFAVEGSSSTSHYYSHNIGRGESSLSRGAATAARDRKALVYERKLLLMDSSFSAA
jgi:ABC-type Fe3+/spermidine/putrescine transport system ATPase subunit